MTKIHQSLRGRVVNHEYSRLPQMFDSYQDMQARTPEKYAQDHFGPFPESEHQKPYENPDQDYQELEALYTPWETPPYVGPIDIPPIPPGETKICKALSDICYCPNETKSAAVRFTDKECCSHMTYDLIHTAGTFTIKATCSKITITASEDASGSIRFTAHRSGSVGTDLTAEQCSAVQTNKCTGDDGQPTTISYEQRMNVNTSQTLSVLHPRSGVSYKWKITGGGGTLSATKGASTVYTAPASNPNCNLSPTVTLSVDGKGCYSQAGGVCDTAKIAINGYGSGHDTAMRYYDKHPYWPLTCQLDVYIGQFCKYHVLTYNCVGTQWFDNYEARICETIGAPCTTNPQHYTWEDARTPAMIAAGCCPPQLM